jgi:enoyl-CoA hydratase
MTIWCRIEDVAGRITLQRPDALNALTHAMCLEVDKALDAWRDKVSIVIIDADGDKAFCAGGDIADLYASAQRGDVTYGQTIWRDEYRMNAKIAAYPVPIVSFLHGFTMGGGVGLGCHAAHRIVCETSKIAMPECGIGLVPDVGGSRILARAPKRYGVFLGLTGQRMGPEDAIYAGFADCFVPQALWADLKSALIHSGDTAAIAEVANEVSPPDIPVDIETLFAGRDLRTIRDRLAEIDDPAFVHARAALSRNAPLAMAAFLEMIGRLGTTPTLHDALTLEYRYTSRSIAQGDFIEGIRAAVIDKNNAPQWHHANEPDVPRDLVLNMLATLGDDELNLEGIG